VSDLIGANDRYAWKGEAYDENDAAAIEQLLVGRKVTKVGDDHLLLDDGTLLKLIGHEGGCACSAGVDNVITRVEIADERTADAAHEYGGHWRIFVFADNERINLATFTGDDGNGYYGTGFEVLVKRAAGGDPR
jgi:hypothetical protein